MDKNAISSQYDRLLKLEELASDHQIELAAEQVRAIEKANPRLMKSPYNLRGIRTK